MFFSNAKHVSVGTSPAGKNGIVNVRKDLILTPPKTKKASATFFGAGGHQGGGEGWGVVWDPLNVEGRGNIHKAVTKRYIYIYVYIYIST